MKPYVIIKLIGGGTYTQPLDDLGVWFEEIKNAEVGTVWRILKTEMTEAEYLKLPEFAGH